MILRTCPPDSIQQTLVEFYRALLLDSNWHEMTKMAVWWDLFELSYAKHPTQLSIDPIFLIAPKGEKKYGNAFLSCIFLRILSFSFISRCFLIVSEHFSWYIGACRFLLHHEGNFEELVRALSLSLSFSEKQLLKVIGKYSEIRDGKENALKKVIETFFRLVQLNWRLILTF